MNKIFQWFKSLDVSNLNVLALVIGVDPGFEVRGGARIGEGSWNLTITSIYVKLKIN